MSKMQEFLKKMIGKVFKPSDCKEQMLKNLKQGLQKGSTTYIDEIDPLWTWRKQEGIILSGYLGEGKSLFIKQLAIIKALEDKWRFVFNSPEDYPPDAFYDDIIHTISGKTTDKTNQYNTLIQDDEYDRIVDMIDPYFDFIHIEAKENTVENWLADAQRLHNEEPRDVYIGDPIMKFKRSSETKDMRDDHYAAHVDSLITEFARENDCLVIIIMHQNTPTVDDNKKYPKPSMYRVKGGGSWADGIDNVLFVWRPDVAEDKTSTKVIFGSEKIKKHKLVGLPGQVELSFDRKTNRYTYPDGQSLYNFNKWLKK